MMVMMVMSFGVHDCDDDDDDMLILGLNMYINGQADTVALIMMAMSFFMRMMMIVIQLVGKYNCCLNNSMYIVNDVT